MRTTYQCELCDSYYRRKDLAERCESFILHPPKFKVGDEVTIKEYKGDIQKTTITGAARIRREYYLGYLEDLENTPEDDQSVEKILKVFPKVHYYTYKLKSYFKCGEDGNDYTDVWAEDGISPRAVE